MFRSLTFWNFVIVVGSQRKVGLFSWEGFSWSAWDWSGNVNIAHTEFRKYESDNKRTYSDASLFFKYLFYFNFCLTLQCRVSLFVHWVITAIVKVPFFFSFSWKCYCSLLHILVIPVLYWVWAVSHVRQTGVPFRISHQFASLFFASWFGLNLKSHIIRSLFYMNMHVCLYILYMKYVYCLLQY